jgi:MoaA/NifB/PqqE/SkfB family radical SAM enzyme
MVLKPAFLTFSGGEIFLRKDLEDILQAVAENGQSFAINTNGSLPDRIGKLLSNTHIRRGLMGINVSLDGPKEIHDKIRGKGSFDRLAESIKIIRDHGITLYSLTIIQALNKDHLAGIGEISRRLGCDSHMFNVEIQGLRHIKYYSPDMDKYLGGKTLVFHCCEDTYTGVGCTAGIKQVNFEPDGRVLPCPMVDLEK